MVTTRGYCALGPRTAVLAANYLLTCRHGRDTSTYSEYKYDAEYATLHSCMYGKRSTVTLSLA
jgi:hypothetical protein